MTSNTFECSISTKFRWRVWQVEVMINNIDNLVRNSDRRVVRVEHDVEVLHVKFFSVVLGFRDLVVLIVLRGLILLVLLSFGILFLFMVLINLNRTVTKIHLLYLPAIFIRARLCASLYVQRLHSMLPHAHAWEWRRCHDGCGHHRYVAREPRWPNDGCGPWSRNTRPPFPPRPNQYSFWGRQASDTP